MRVDCQVLTGSPYRVSAPAASETFELTAGQPKIYVKTADDGTKRAQAFCPDCGTPIYAAAVRDTPLQYTDGVSSSGGLAAACRSGVARLCLGLRASRRC